MYEGDFKDDEPNGKGLMIWMKGKQYNGDFKNGKMEGHGIFTWPSG